MYAEHTSCISEAEKYEKSLFRGKKEKLNPQEAWNEHIRLAASAASDAPQGIRQYILKLGSLSNVPRNANKFKNFLKNSFRMYNESLINEVWTFLDKTKPAGNSEPEVKIAKNIVNQTDSIKSVFEEPASCDEAIESSDIPETPEEKKERKRVKKEKRAAESDFSETPEERKERKKAKKEKKRKEKELDCNAD
jgi:cell growth-regulating nucleolar protein